MTKSTAHRYIKIIVRYFVSIKGQFIVWPREEAVNDVVEGFYALQKIRGIIGAIDGCHTKINRPSNQKAYCNRINEHSILLQGVCDNKKQFINIFAEKLVRCMMQDCWRFCITQFIMVGCNI